MGNANLTAYEFAVKTNNEALELFEKLGNLQSLTFCSGENLYQAKEKLACMEDYEKKHRTQAMAYIVDSMGENIYERLIWQFNPQEMLHVGLITKDDVKKCAEFRRKMVQLSNRVKAFDKKLSA